MAAARKRSGKLPQKIAGEIIELATGGMARNEIARQLHVSNATVTRIAHEAGLSFNRAATKAATEAKVQDAKARRAVMLEQQLEIQQLMQAKMLAVLQKREKWPTLVKRQFGVQETRYLHYVPADDFARVQTALASGQVVIARIETALNPAAAEAGNLLDEVASSLGVVDE